MLKKTVTYVDYNGDKQEDVLYFNLNKAELGKLQVRMDGKFIDHLQALTEKRKIESLYNFIYNLILDSYGEKDVSGKRFIKSPDMRWEFENSLAFSEVLMDVIKNAENMAAFVKAIIPPDMVTEAGDMDVKALPTSD